MTDIPSATTLHVVIGLLAVGGTAFTLAGIYPGSILLIVALVLAVTQRSNLARALRSPDTRHRRRRLQIAVGLAVVSVASYATYVLLIGDRWTIRESVLTIIGSVSMIGAIAFLVAGLLTPRTSDARRPS